MPIGTLCCLSSVIQIRSSASYPYIFIVRVSGKNIIASIAGITKKKYLYCKIDPASAFFTNYSILRTHAKLLVCYIHDDMNGSVKKCYNILIMASKLFACKVP